jgi:hypothetical protein
MNESGDRFECLLCPSERRMMKLRRYAFADFANESGPAAPRERIGTAARAASATAMAY